MAAAPGPVLLCFDGSEDSIRAIAKTGELFAARDAVVLTVWEPISVWEPYDPGAVLSAAVAKLGEKELGLDEIAQEIARERLEREVATELEPAAIVVGARGLSRIQSALLGGVSAAVVVHAKQPVLVIPPQD